ncbi:unnamed protein product [Acanthosepion pharaonis]|uniref:Uncharacterized protein n=1 Tax=Acanthosepion pharaonis TaxID=158019 RepID=A0A812DW05_ACAPH|nr:unnamed protein product [Sepia pharaonis]
MQNREATSVLVDFTAASGVEQRLEVGHHVEHAAEQIDIEAPVRPGRSHGRRDAHRFQHFGPGHRILSACGVPSPSTTRRPCSRKPSFLTTSRAGHDDNAFQWPAVCQNCSGNLLRKKRLPATGLRAIGTSVSTKPCLQAALPGDGDTPADIPSRTPLAMAESGQKSLFASTRRYDCKRLQIAEAVLRAVGEMVRHRGLLAIPTLAVCADGDGQLHRQAEAKSCAVSSREEGDRSALLAVRFMDRDYSIPESEFRSMQIVTIIQQRPSTFRRNPPNAP